MPTKSIAVNTWLSPCLQRGLQATDSGRTALTAAIAADPVAYDNFRFRVLHTALVHHLRQQAGEVTKLLNAEFGRDVKSVSHQAAPRDEAEYRDEDGLFPDGAQFGRWPTGALVTMAGEGFDDPRYWAKLVSAQPEHPVALFALIVARHVQSKIRGKGPRDPDDGPFTPRGAQHAVAGMLDHLEAADPECGGHVRDAKGWYGRVLHSIVDHLSEENADSAYTLRKLFPHHAWPPDAPDARSIPARVLQEALIALHGEELAPLLANALTTQWDTHPEPSVRGSLSASATHHGTAESFPGWPEVALWTGDAKPGSDINYNTLQRRVSRLDQEIAPYVERQRNRLRELLEP